MLHNPPQHDRFMRVPELRHVTGLARTQIYRLMAAGEFPRPIKRGRSSLWSESAVQGWIARQKAASRSH